MWWRKRKAAKPQTNDELLAEAVAQLGRNEARKRKRRRFMGLHLPYWLDRRVLVGLGAILLLVLADAVRRENEEFRATLTGIGGYVRIQKSETASIETPKLNQSLSDAAVVHTGPGSHAVLEFVDGSVVTLGENTVYVVRLMEYSRGGAWRSRAFLLRVGRMWANVGPNFGDRSEMRVYTPSAVAAVRGTRFAVRYDPEKRRTLIACNEGYVQAAGFTGPAAWVQQGAAGEVDYGQPARMPRWMRGQEAQSFLQTVLYKPIPPEEWIRTAELTLTQLLDAPLSILGIGQCSWAAGSADYARRAAAMEQLRRIMQLMEGQNKYPEFVDPATLAPLSVTYVEAGRMLKAFHCAGLASYECLAQGRSYRITAQARDKRRTRFTLTPTGITSQAGG